MPVVAFDSKQFLRGKVERVQKGTKWVHEYKGFQSQLGVGVEFKDDKQFLARYIEKNKSLQSSFNLELGLPFCSSTFLKQSLGLEKTIAFVDQLVTDVQQLIKRVHFSYVILPLQTINTIPVGGFQCPLTHIPRTQFIDNLGPMFSYLTAYSFLWFEGFNVPDMDFHIDSFSSRETQAWNAVIAAIKPKVYFRGDECNPYISCADLIAFLTDAKLYVRHLKLEPNDLKKAWEDYSFSKTTNFLDPKSLSVYAWKTDRRIEFSKYLVNPTIFLLVDEIDKPEYGDIAENFADEVGVENEQDSLKRPKQKFKDAIKSSPVYYSAIKYAYSKGGSMKIFHRSEDMRRVRDGDILVYVGDVSRRIAMTFKDAYTIEVCSGIEMRRKIGDV